MGPAKQMGEELRRAGVMLQEAGSLAIDTLRAHKMRSFLTLLGVILAVTTLVAVMSVLNGLNVYVADKIANLGANVFLVDRIGIVTNYADYLNARKRPPLRMDDFDALRNNMTLATQLAAEQDTTADVRYQNNRMQDVRLIGATPNFAEMEDIEVGLGRMLTPTDEAHRSPVCFIGPDLVEHFFPNLDPIGREIRVGMEQYEVVGVAKARGTILGQSQDNFVLTPLSTYRKAWTPADDSITLFIQARGTEWISAAEDEARVLLRARRHVAYNDPDNFAIFGSSSITSLWQRLTGNIFGITIWLTSVFMVVGGIVIMNIMLASVTERTREIGLRKSLGARRRHIVLQFLMESAVLAAVGGAAGILFAVGIAQVVRVVTPIPISTPVRAVVIALVLSTAVGLFFGIYPAMRASRLDPIEALRAEA